MLKRWVWLVAIVILLDQVTKIAVSQSMQPWSSLRLTGFFNLVLAHNTGAAFSFLHDAGGGQRWLFAGIAVIASGFILVLLRRHHQDLLFAGALSLILAGALGNLIDRVRLGFVVDFLDFHWLDWHFPAFNVADIAITLGAGLLILDSFKKEKNGNSAG